MGEMVVAEGLIVDHDPNVGILSVVDWYLLVRVDQHAELVNVRRQPSSIDSDHLVVPIACSSAIVALMDDSAIECYEILVPGMFEDIALPVNTKHRRVEIHFLVAAHIPCQPDLISLSCYLHMLAHATVLTASVSLRQVCRHTSGVTSTLWLTVAPIAPLRLTVAALWLTVASLRLTVAALRLTVASLRLTVARLRLTVAALRLTVAALRLTVASLRLTVAALRLTVASLRLTVASLWLTVSPLHVTSLWLPVSSRGYGTRCRCGAPRPVPLRQIESLVAVVFLPIRSGVFGPSWGQGWAPSWALPLCAALCLILIVKSAIGGSELLPTSGQWC